MLLALEGGNSKNCAVWTCCIPCAIFQSASSLFSRYKRSWFGNRIFISFFRKASIR